MVARPSARSDFFNSLLERRTSRVGRDRVDHPPGSHDDLANSACGALVLVAAETDRGLLEWRCARGAGHDAEYYHFVARSDGAEPPILVAPPADPVPAVHAPVPRPSAGPYSLPVEGTRVTCP